MGKEKLVLLVASLITNTSLPAVCFIRRFLYCIILRFPATLRHLQVIAPRICLPYSFPFPTAVLYRVSLPYSFQFPWGFQKLCDFVSYTSSDFI